MQTVKVKIREFLTDYIGDDGYLDDEEILASSQVSSLFVMELVVFLEEEFEVQLDEADLMIDNFASVSRMAALVARKQNLPPQ